MEKGRAFTLHEHHERALASALGVKTSELPGAIDKMRAAPHDVRLAIMYGSYLKAEQQLDEAMRLYEEAAELHYSRAIKELDE